MKQTKKLCCSRCGKIYESMGNSIYDTENYEDICNNLDNDLVNSGDFIIKNLGTFLMQHGYYYFHNNLKFSDYIKEFLIRAQNLYLYKVYEQLKKYAPTKEEKHAVLDSFTDYYFF